ncbi:Arabinanase/levansucrase/invertase [Cutaneotrichosporon oleaginosum]|uniref:Arabinanase/levansucrase/invertase n=1 Tax=Cutaneotrichosporon oleaginosum TaxID=879819 RepID=A0A0J0XCY7_9TREE|nr:Arabinanase/levansucrase/invertase [Cutaneotrichosporon oleaginosum]KLT38926.1 Arabinanase/levansucrase/invertase [Cutaneotrichosporon oleaginosum]TXT14710.1 hypothetical protein COLE_00903 [Cutaneotrichosporon oleaginosum]
MATPAPNSQSHSGGAQPSADGTHTQPAASGTDSGAKPFPTPTSLDTPIQGDYTGFHRPQVHYTPPIGYMGEPNAFIKDSTGTWHLFYQYNPTNASSGGEHWGHATTKDGYKWENQPVALFPTEGETSVGTGCVVSDPSNSSGLFGNGTGENLVAVYGTSSGVQLATSLDGQRFTPQGTTVAPERRDPRVVRYQDWWVMSVVYNGKVEIHTSTDLKTWTLSQEIPTGEVTSPLLTKVDDKWALIASNMTGPNVYWAGDFNGTVFAPESLTPKPMEWGPDGYGGAAFVDGNTTVYMTLAANWAYADKVPTGDLEWWRGTMTVPRVLSMSNSSAGHVLAQEPLNPAPVIGSQVATVVSDKGKIDYTFDGTAATSRAMMVLLNITNIEGATPDHSVNWTFYSADKKEWLESGYKFDGTAWIRRGKVGPFKTEGYTEDITGMYKPEGNHMTVAALVDRTILETYVDSGKAVATNLFYSNASLSQVGLWADVPEGTNVEAHVFALNSAWENTADHTSSSMSPAASPTA